VDNKTTLNGAVREVGRKEHLMIREKVMSLGVEELFKRPILPVPEEVLRVFDEVRVETFEFGNSGPDVTVYENDHYSLGHGRASEVNVEQFDEQEQEQERETEDNEAAKRCEALLGHLKTLKSRISFSRLAPQDRKEASNTFYDLLVLANQDLVKLEQKGFNREVFIKCSKV